MMNNSYDKDILTYFLSHYENSTKTKTISVKPDRFYRLYSKNTADYTKVDALNNAIESLSKTGFITAEYQPLSSEIKVIRLRSDKVKDIEIYLENKYGITPIGKQSDSYLELIERYSGKSRLCDLRCTYIEERIKTGKITAKHFNESYLADVKREENILSALYFIENNKDNLYLREASMLIFGSSHDLDPSNKEAGYLLEEVCRFIREADNRPQEDGEPLDDILCCYSIRKEPETLRIKGNVILTIGGSKIDISAFSNGIEFSAADIPFIESVIIRTNMFMTIENQTSYDRMSCENAVVFYLGGFANRFQKDFIRQVYKDNPGIKYLHFGDIDINGLWIHHNLRETTKAPFGMYCMDKSVLCDPKYTSCLRPLTDNDRKRLPALMELPEYREVASYMAQTGYKLEQEIVSLSLERMR